MYALSGFMAVSRPSDAMAAPKACKEGSAQRTARRDVKAPAGASSTTQRQMQATRRRWQKRPR